MTTKAERRAKKQRTRERKRLNKACGGRKLHGLIHETLVEHFRGDFAWRDEELFSGKGLGLPLDLNRMTHAE